MKKSISGNSGKERGELQRFLGNVSLSDLAKGINSKPEDFGLQVEGCDELELRERKSEDYRAKLEEYRLKITAHVILANIDGCSTKEIQRALNEHNIMLSYKNLDEMIFRWRTAQAEGWPDDLRERLSGIAQCAPGSRRDRQNDVECTLLNGRKKAISLDKLAESGAPWYGSVDTSPDEVLYRTQYGEWILVSEPIDWGTGKCSIEARELTPAQAHAWFWENQIDLPDSLKGIDLHDMDPSEKKGSDLTSAEKAVPKRTPAMDRLTLVRTLTGLDPADFATLIAMIPGAARQRQPLRHGPGAGRRADPLGRELDWTGAGGDRGGSQGDSEALDRPAATDGDAGGGPTRRTVPRPPALQLAVYHAGHALQGAAGVPGRPAEEPGEGGPARRGGAWAGGRGQDPGSARVRLEA